ncbi:MAG: PAS domain S-box protein [Candidatus Rokubacteria bacterium]|nr:PAS domain S-box protein [Candidatus Rokubacteria bacterium]
MDLDELISNTADGVCAVTAEGKVTLWNRFAEKIMGHTAREILGRPCCDVFVGRDAAGNRLCYRGCHVQTLVKMGEPVQHFEMATRTKAGKPIWIDVSILVVPGSRNGLQTTVHLFRDVTATHEMEAVLRERLAQGKPAPAAVVGEPSSTPLTRREIEILRLMTGGANTKTMAERLHVSPATVRNHVQNIFGKLGVHSRLEAVAHVTTHGLL